MKGLQDHKLKEEDKKELEEQIKEFREVIKAADNNDHLDFQISNLVDHYKA